MNKTSSSHSMPTCVNTHTHTFIFTANTHKDAHKLYICIRANSTTYLSISICMLKESIINKRQELLLYNRKRKYINVWIKRHLHNLMATCVNTRTHIYMRTYTHTYAYIHTQNMPIHQPPNKALANGC